MAELCDFTIIESKKKLIGLQQKTKKVASISNSSFMNDSELKGTGDFYFFHL